MISDEIAHVFETDKTGAAAIGHGYTYSGHPVGAAAALACLRETKRLKVNENAAARGKELRDGLHKLSTKYELIGNVRGEGLMCALELVSNRETKKPLDKPTIGIIAKTAYENGAMIRVSGNNIIISPPLVLSSADVQILLSSLEAGFSAVQ